MNMEGAWVARIIAVVAILAAYLVERTTGSRTAFWICIIAGLVCVGFAAFRSISPRRARDDPSAAQNRNLQE